MSVIRVLSEVVANKIAAGEVIERPASIVKELVENALDAGACSVEVEIEHGGKSLIRVADDGCGMDRADAKLAFQSHATSKIAELEDLQEVGSFGFRGEALPSIAAVSRCRLITRTEKAATGTEVVIEGGAFKGTQEHPCRKGTIVEVRDLFFNTPARRKFLKGESTELGQVQDVLARLALSALGTRFLLRSGKKTLLDLPATDRLLARAAALLGEESGKELLELESSREGVRLHGVIGKPAFNRGNRREVQFFVNRRWIKSLPLTYALQAGYHGLLMEGRYPVAVLFLDLDLKRVDVNVHPTKQEVRIANEQEITGFIQQSARERLTHSGDLSPKLRVATGLQIPSQRRYGLKSAGPAAPAWGAVMETAVAQAPKPLAEPATRAAAPEPIAIKDKLKITRVVGQVHRSYILAETEEGFIVVDQHAAHERVVYESLLRGLRSGRAERQMLFLDEVLQVRAGQRDLFKKSLPLLAKAGFEIEGFGGDSAVVRAYPACFGEVNPVQLLRDFLDEVEEGKVRTTLEAAPEALAALCACKKRSVKASDPMELPAQRLLLERLAGCESPFNCPHGRPVFFTQTLSSLEKQFKRT